MLEKFKDKNDRPSVDRLLQRSSAAWVLRNQWRSILKEAYSMVMAGRNPYDVDAQSPRPLDQQYDSTSVIGAYRLANRLLTEMTPPYASWANIVSGPLLEIQYSKEQLDQAKPMLEKIDKVINMILNTGSAVDARSEAFFDVVVAGLGCVLGQDDPKNDVDPILDQSVSQSEIALEDNEKGQVGGIFRNRKLKASQIHKIWPDAKLPKELSDMMAKTDKDPVIEFVEACYEQEKDSQTVWNYDVIWSRKGKGSDEDHRIVKRTDLVCPWSIWRWSKLPGIPYGPGPVLLALADIRTANTTMKMLLQNAALALSGMYLVRDDGVINVDNITITTGGLIPVASTGGSMGASIVPLETGRNFDIGQIVLEKLQMSIKKHLYDNSLPPDRAQPKSATEIIQLIKEFTQDIGGGIGRLSADTTQYVRRRLEILINRGMIPKVKIDQFTLKVQINSPLVRAQQLSEVENIVNWYNLMISLGGPQSAAMVGILEKIQIYIAEKMGIPSSLLRTIDEIKAKQEEDVKAALAIQQAAAALPGQAAPALPV